MILVDIFVDEEGFVQKATQIAVEKLQEIPDANKLPQGYADDVAYDFERGLVDSDHKWYLDAFGIVYVYTNFEDTVWHGYIPNYYEDMPEPDESVTETDEENFGADSFLPGNITVKMWQSI